MPKSAKAKKVKAPLEANASVDVSPSERRWSQYVGFYNKRARALGLPQIPSPEWLSFGGALLEELDVLRMKAAYLSYLIDVMDEIAAMGFAESTRNRQNAEQSRNSRISPMTPLIRHLASKSFEDWTADELWPELLGSDGHKLKIHEIVDARGNRSLKWRNRDGPEEGDLSYATFVKRLSQLRHGE